jgi:ABC-type transport system involved in multi-copper enzyme maturation permease subunit/heme exporter protein D
MTVLPIAERELRVAARRKTTYWSRLVSAALALLIFAGVLAIFELGGRIMGFTSQLGPILFGIFSWLSFAFVCVAGVFLTSDSLSEEKREGTLGLLFLTDLRGYDVVLGKLLSHSLVAVYGLLAALPVIGLAFLLGGVTGAEFGRCLLVLCNTLFFSLAAGVFVSSISRDSHKAMNATLLVCGLFVLLLPATDWALAGWDPTKFEARFSLASPGYTFTQIQRNYLGGFWASLITANLLAWGLLTLASLLAPRAWQETSTAPAAGASSRPQRRRFGSPEKRRAFRRRWLEENPVRWLAARDWWLGRFQWAVLFGIGGLFGISASGIDTTQQGLALAHGLHGLLGLLLFLWVAAFASRFFVDATRTGTLELLLAAPVGAEQIVRGQAWALRRTFLWPALTLLLIGSVISGWQILESIRMFKAGNATAGTSLPPSFIANQVVSAATDKITFVTGLVAVAWFGMWMGVTSKKVNTAVIKTVVFVKVLPLLATMFISGMLIFVILAAGTRFGVTAPYGLWLSQGITTLLAVGANVAFIVIARRKLLNNFRLIVAQAAGAATTLKPPRLSPCAQTPVLPAPAP